MGPRGTSYELEYLPVELEIAELCTTSCEEIPVIGGAEVGDPADSPLVCMLVGLAEFESDKPILVSLSTRGVTGHTAESIFNNINEIRYIIFNFDI